MAGRGALRGVLPGLTDSAGSLVQLSGDDVDGWSGRGGDVGSAHFGTGSKGVGRLGPMGSRDVLHGASASGAPSKGLPPLRMGLGPMDIPRSSSRASSTVPPMLVSPASSLGLSEAPSGGFPARTSDAATRGRRSRKQKPSRGGKHSTRKRSGNICI